jgi:hypothetical protein
MLIYYVRWTLNSVPNQLSLLAATMLQSSIAVAFMLTTLANMILYLPSSTIDELLTEHITSRFLLCNILLE